MSTRKREVSESYKEFLEAEEADKQDPQAYAKYIEEEASSSEVSVEEVQKARDTAVPTYEKEDTGAGQWKVEVEEETFMVPKPMRGDQFDDTREAYGGDISTSDGPSALKDIEPARLREAEGLQGEQVYVVEEQGALSSSEIEREVEASEFANDQERQPEGIEKLHGEISRYRVNREDGSTEDLAEILGQIKDTYDSLSGEKKQDARNRFNDSTNNILDAAVEERREIAVQRARQVDEKVREVAANREDMDVVQKTRALDQIEDQYRKLPEGPKEAVEEVLEQEGLGGTLDDALNENRATLAQAVQVRETQDLVEQVEEFRGKREGMNVAEETESLDRIEERYEALPKSRKKAIRRETTADQMKVIQEAQGEKRISLSEAIRQQEQGEFVEKEERSRRQRSPADKDGPEASNGESTTEEYPTEESPTEESPTEESSTEESSTEENEQERDRPSPPPRGKDAEESVENGGEEADQEEQGQEETATVVAGRKNPSTENPPEIENQTQRDLQRALSRHMGEDSPDMLQSDPQTFADRVAEETSDDFPVVERVSREGNTAGVNFSEDASTMGPEYWKVDVDGDEYIIPQPQNDGGFRERGYRDSGEVVEFGDDDMPVPVSYNGGNPERTIKAQQGEGTQEDKRTVRPGQREPGESPGEDVPSGREGKRSETGGELPSEGNADTPGVSEEEREAAAKYFASDELVVEERRNFESLDREYRDGIGEAFENGQRARQAYMKNRGNAGIERAWEVMKNPDIAERDSDLRHPGKKANGSGVETGMRRMEEEMAKAKERQRRFEDQRFEAEKDMPEDFLEKAPRPDAEKVNQKIEEIRGGEDEWTEPDLKKTEDLEQEKEQLQEAISAQGEGITEKIENARQSEADAEERFEAELGAIYENPKVAADQLESEVSREGFDRAVKRLAREPESFGAVRDGFKKTEQFKSVRKHGHQSEPQSAAQAYVEADEESVVEAFSERTLHNAKKAELQAQKKMEDQGQTREEFYASGGKAVKDKMNSSAEVLQRSRREIDRRDTVITRRSEESYEQEASGAEKQSTSRQTETGPTKENYSDEESREEQADPQTLRATVRYKAATKWIREKSRMQDFFEEKGMDGRPDTEVPMEAVERIRDMAAKDLPDDGMPDMEPPPRAVNEVMREIEDEVYEDPNQAETLYASAAEEEFNQDPSDVGWTEGPTEGRTLAQEKDELRRATAAPGKRTDVRMHNAKERSEKAAQRLHDHFAEASDTAAEAERRTKRFRKALETEGFTEAVRKESSIDAEPPQDRDLNAAVAYLNAEEGGSGLKEAAEYAIRDAKYVEMKAEDVMATEGKDYQEVFEGASNEWKNRLNQSSKIRQEVQREFNRRTRREGEDPSKTEAELLGETGEWQPDVYQEESVAKYYAAKELLEEKRRERDETGRAFEENAIDKFEDREAAREAYRENARRMGAREAREIMDRPENYSQIKQQLPTGGFATDSVQHPGDLRPEEEIRGEKVHELKKELRGLDESIQSLNEVVRDLEEEVPGQKIEEEPIPNERKINEEIRNLDSEIEERIPEQKAGRLSEIARQKQEADRLEEEVTDLNGVLELEGDSLGEKTKNAREDVEMAREKFERSLDGIYQDPERAVSRFEEIANEEGFDEALNALGGEDPERLGDLVGDEYVSWETQLEASDTNLGQEIGRRNAAETFVKAADGSEAKAAAEWRIKDAKRTELDLKNAAGETSQSREEIYRSGSESFRQRIDQSKKVLQQTEREFNKRIRSLADHPRDHYEGELLEERRNAGDSTVDALGDQTQSDQTIKGGLAATAKKREEDLKAALAQVYDNPEKVQGRLEEAAFADGISTDTDSFKDVQYGLAKDLDQFGSTQGSDLKAFQSSSDRGKSWGDKLQDSLRKARYGAEVAEEITGEEGPDLETEEAMRNVRQGAKIVGAGAVLGAIAAKGAGGYAYNKMREKMDEQQARQEISQRFHEYGKAMENYVDHVRGDENSVVHEETGSISAEEGLDPKKVKVSFGKYEGDTVAEVAEKDPEYADWAAEAIDQDKVDATIIEEGAFKRATREEGAEQSKTAESQDEVAEEIDPSEVDITFGKYGEEEEDKTAEELAREDPEYAEWVLENDAGPNNSEAKETQQAALKKALEESGQTETTEDAATEDVADSPSEVEISAGKYEGETVGDVVEKDPEYAQNAQEVLSGDPDAQKAFADVLEEGEQEAESKTGQEQNQRPAERGENKARKRDEPLNPGRVQGSEEKDTELEIENDPSAGGVAGASAALDKKDLSQKERREAINTVKQHVNSDAREHRQKIDSKQASMDPAQDLRDKMEENPNPSRPRDRSRSSSEEKGVRKDQSRTGQDGERSSTSSSSNRSSSSNSSSSSEGGKSDSPSRGRGGRGGRGR
jgi:hypothetical protein